MPLNYLHLGLTKLAFILGYWDQQYFEDYPLLFVW